MDLFEKVELLCAWHVSKGEVFFGGKIKSIVSLFLSNGKYQVESLTCRILSEFTTRAYVAGYAISIGLPVSD